MSGPVADPSISMEVVASFVAILISVVTIPISHYIGRHAAKHDFINQKIDELSTLLDQCYADSIRIINSSGFDNNDYLLNVGMHIKIRWIVDDISALDKSHVESRKARLSEIKRILTDDVFHSNQRVASAQKLMKVSLQLRGLFSRRF